MPIVQISLANTFFEWLGTTVNLVHYANLLETGNYEKSSNTLFINSPEQGLFVILRQLLIIQQTSIIREHLFRF